MRSLVVALTLGVALAGCSSRSDSTGASATSTPPDVETTTEDPSTSLDTGPFCTNVRALVDLDDGSAGETSPAAVVAQADELVALLDEVAVDVPADAPPEVELLLDDLRAIATAIQGAGGDTDAAYASLEADQPELWDRIVGATAHDAAFEFFAARCGTPLP